MFNQSTQIKDLLTTARTAGVIVAANPTLDMMAAGLGMYLVLSQMGKKVSITCSTPPNVGISNLVGINKVKTNVAVGGGTDGMIISLPYSQGSIEKISYDIVGDRINLTVVPGTAGLNFTTEDITYQTPSESSASDLVFTIGVLSESELPSEILDNPDVPVVNIDNATNNTGFGTVAIVDGAYSSLSEMVAKLLQSLNAIIDVDSAQNLLSGIVDETKNFQNPDTSPTAFEMVSFLIQKGAQRRAAQQVQTDTPVDPFFKPQNGFGAAQQMPKKPMMKPQQQPQNRPQFPKQQNVQARPNMNSNMNNNSNNTKQQPPKDWFEPKIYKGSTQI